MSPHIHHVAELGLVTTNKTKISLALYKITEVVECYFLL